MLMRADLLLAVLLAQLGLVDSAFINPPASGPRLTFALDLVWKLESSHTIGWNTSLEAYSVVLFQQDFNTNAPAISIRQVYVSQGEGSGVHSFQWTVDSYSANLDFSNVFFFWIAQGIPGAITSHYFNITSVDLGAATSPDPQVPTNPLTSTSTPTTTTASTSVVAGLSSPSSFVTSTSSRLLSSSGTPASGTVALISSTPSMTSTSSTLGETASSGSQQQLPSASASSNSALSSAAKIGLGVGLGVGISLLIAIVFLLALILIRRRKGSLEKARPAIESDKKPPLASAESTQPPGTQTAQPHPLSSAYSGDVIHEVSGRDGALFEAHGDPTHHEVPANDSRGFTASPYSTSHELGNTPR